LIANCADCVPVGLINARSLSKSEAAIFGMFVLN
jgi:hypothetical protein